MTATENGLRRRLGLGLLLFYGLGNILGAGIYVLVGKVAGSAGLFAPLAFMIAAALAAITALTYSELGARYPLSAGEAVYIRRGLGTRWLPTLVGLLILLMGSVSAATISRGFVGYFQVLWDLPDALVLSGLLLVLGAVAAWGIVASVRLAAMLTLLEILGLVLVLWQAVPTIEWVTIEATPLWPPADGMVWHGILYAAFLAFYAYLGFEDMVNVAEEVRRPQRTIPLAIIGALIISTLLYMAIAWVAIFTVPTDELGASEAPLALVYARASGEAPTLLSLISLLAVVNGALIQIIMGARILYGMSRQGWLPAWLSHVHPRTGTPMRTTAIVSGLVLLLALWLPLVRLAEATSMLVLVIFSLVNLSLWRIKAREPQPAGVFCFPRWVPLLGFIASFGFLLQQLL